MFFREIEHYNFSRIFFDKLWFFFREIKKLSYFFLFQVKEYCPLVFRNYIYYYFFFREIEHYNFHEKKLIIIMVFFFVK